MVLVALVAASSLAQITAAFAAVTGFYLLARSIQGLVLLSRDSILDLNSLTNRWVGAGVEVLARVMPDFAQFTRSEWLIHELPSRTELVFVLGQTAVYIPLLFVVGLIDFQRRNY
jgi:hypothetical protein